MGRLVTMAILVLALGAAGCSGDSDDSGSPSTAAPVSGSPTSTTANSDSAGSSDTGRPLERYADHQSQNYDDPAHWVCRPDTDDICDSNLDATVVAADGKTSVEPFEAAANPPIDCFYVYPTISRDKTMFSDWEASKDEEGFVTLNQAARLQSQCRLFAPVYRQRTLTGLTAALTGGEVAPGETVDPYADVVDAWRTYMANDNRGRGVVLIGHSQGSAMLSRLIAEEIDPNDDVRALLVSAYLAGWSVTVPAGEDVGAQFENVGVCKSDTQVGCVVSWASFRASSPPPANSFFGGPVAGSTAERGEQPERQDAVCANPADLAGGVNGEMVELDSYFPANREASILGDLGLSTTAAGWLDSSAGQITTPFVAVPGLVKGRCVREGGFSYLAVEPQPDPGPRADDIPGDLTPEWGLHLIDVNLVMGDVVDLVARQAKAYSQG